LGKGGAMRHCKVSNFYLNGLQTDLHVTHRLRNVRAILPFDVSWWLIVTHCEPGSNV
jgi:hypothetical protein